MSAAIGAPVLGSGGCGGIEREEGTCSRDRKECAPTGSARRNPDDPRPGVSTEDLVSGADNVFDGITVNPLNPDHAERQIPRGDRPV